MDKIIALSNRTEVRDKITRIIQNFARLVSWYLSDKDKKLQKKFIDLLSNFKIQNFYFKNYLS